ncbi:family 78 glycoside hydrolase catalytic domain [Glycomyces algeriensis]|uniref:alpha-L-rhamnosidase n=1 Tax=Glycomyces algeriensis TaxID=256037 RepID=A0A9W6GBQ1_9ACTN|nr:family 78 glycoside hydrolase catalytic domain [Glycomyces algeriensis]MDA1365498.1 family 78 glycoside hydrolase catalytic domain [Glycomyces algeriensis]MDR7351184.1 alpha-L-rhamnosidase [Glycomyces algeriensis]GLI43897.1 alpha-L-rhamnosidase [Glycomyces algeriensis]
MNPPHPSVHGLRAEYRTDAPFVGTSRPRLSWKTATTATNWTQASAEIEWRRGDTTETARVEDAESVFVAWPFAPLRARERGALRVRVRGADGAASDWSAPLEIRAGFLAEGEWRARFVSAPGAGPAQPVLLRREFAVREELRAATLYSTARGLFQVEIGGTAVDDERFKPGWTAYRQRLVHETDDVTALLAPGPNAIGAVLAGGWYTERFGFHGDAEPFYGTHPAFAAQLVLEYEDGATELVATGDDGWRATTEGPLTASGIYAGESYDARRAMPGWSSPGFDDGTWLDAETDTAAAIVPVPRTAPPVRATQELPVAEVITTPSGRTVLDFGQNLVGHLRLRVSGRAGDTVVLRHAEVLEHGELGVRPLRHAAATDRYTLAGNAIETWEPVFTFHGFRYAEVDNWPGTFDPADVTAVVVHSDMDRTGWFESSHEQLNRLHENVVWGMRGNFLSIPTDCPQRDERLGWTGDIQVFAPTASYLFDADGFLASWLEDLALEQEANGGVTFIVPNVLEWAKTPAAAWADAATVVPTVLFERYGDRAVLQRQYPSMRGWVDQVAALAGERRLWEGDFQFGDWLDPNAPPHDPFQARTEHDLVASAYLFRSSRLVAEAARLLGLDGDAARYEAYAREVRAAWLREYVTPAGRIVSDTQTAYALAIMFGLSADPELIGRFGARLAALVERAGHRIGTGFVGTPLIQDALVRTGHADTAEALLMQTGVPSWLYPVTMGATTVWERWDSMLEDGTINPGEMTSFNHYAFGAIADWLHRTAAGLAPLEPGYRRLLVAPVPLAGLDWAAAAHETPYGRAAVRWEAADGGLVVRATVPPNTSARVVLPDRAPEEVGSGEHAWTIADPRAGAV